MNVRICESHSPQPALLPRLVAVVLLFVCAVPALAAESDEPALARFIVKTRDAAQSAELRNVLTSRYGPSVRVAPLFDKVDVENDPDGMARMYRVSIAADRMPTRQPWENAYRLESELELEAVEPDFDSTLRRTVEMSAICLADVEPPQDKNWSLDEIRAPAAWLLQPPPGGKKFGEGITVCHPDTGWSEHVDLDASRLDLTRARNLLDSGLPNAQDPFIDCPLLHPGHGTGTGSVIVSGHESGLVMGVAPRAKLVPIRTAKSVIQLFDSDLARAVNYAVDARCDVISMSLGGRAFFGLKAAIRRAVRNQVIVAAAAGNCVGFVVAPAAYDDTIAVAGTNVRSGPWKGSSHGSAVDISAPAEHVYIARRQKPSDPTNKVEPGEGTSYAVANVAGAAALWLAYHDRAKLLQRYGSGRRLQDVFRELLGQTASVPAPWNPGQYGPGILNVESLLRADLPDVPESAAIVPERDGGELALLAAILDRSPARLGPQLARLFGVGPLDVEDRLRDFGPELVHLALSNPAAFNRLLDQLAGFESGIPLAQQPAFTDASPTLRRQVGAQP